MLLRELFISPRRIIKEGGNLSIGDAEKGEPVHYADKIDLKVHNRTYMVGLLNKLLHDINLAFHKQTRKNLWEPDLLTSREFLSGSSLHFFNTEGVSDEEFTKHKPKVGDIDTQVDRDLEPQVKDFLTSHTNKQIGDTVFLGFGSGNEQYNGLFQFANPPIKIQIDFEFGEYENGVPNEWFKFSHSSDWSDVSNNIKGVFHKYLYRALAGAIKVHAHLKSSEGRGKAKVTTVTPEYLSKYSFGVSGKQGGGLSEPYSHVNDEDDHPQELPHPEDQDKHLPVMQVAKPETRVYDQNLHSQFFKLFGHEPTPEESKLQWSFLGTVELMKTLTQQQQEETVKRFFEICFETGSQMIERDDPKGDFDIKFAAIDQMLEKLNLPHLRPIAEKMAREYEGDFLDLEKFKREYKPTPDQAGKKIQYGRERKNAVADGSWPDWHGGQPLNEAEVQAQLRKGMPHLHDLKAADFLDLLDELKDENDRFVLQNIPLNVKVDGMGGRFGKNAEGRPFMGTSRTEPRYTGGFLKGNIARFKKRLLAKQRGIEDAKSIDDSDPELQSITDQQALEFIGPDSVAMSKKFDEQFNDYMDAIKIIDDALGDHFLVNRQITCEVLDLNFAKETDEGKLVFVGIAYDKLPEGVKIAFVPYRITDATTGKDLPDSDRLVQMLTGLGQQGKVMFISNKLTQNQPLDATAIIDPLGNIQVLKDMLASKKRDQAAEVKAKLEPVKHALEKAIISDPNIIGKDLLGQNYEGIVINSRLGPIKVTSQEQRDVITAKNAARSAGADAKKELSTVDKNPRTAVIATGNFAGHIGHEELINLAIAKANELGGTPFIFVGRKVGKDDPIDLNTKLETLHKLYPEVDIRLVDNPKDPLTGEETQGVDTKKIEYELIKKPPYYNNIVITVGEDQGPSMTKRAEIMQSRFSKWEPLAHVKVSAYVTKRSTGKSTTDLRTALKTMPPEQAYQVWADAYNVEKLGPDYIKKLMSIARKHMNLPEPEHHTHPTQEQPPADPLNIKEVNQRVREMRAQEFMRKNLAEGDVPYAGKGAEELNHVHVQALKNAMSIPNISMNKANGSPYMQYRFGMAMANPDMPRAGAMSGDPLITAYTDADMQKVKDAAKSVGAGAITHLSDGVSNEADGGNTTSPVAKPKKNKYGV
jgi:hypothetical protein